MKKVSDGRGDEYVKYHMSLASLAYAIAANQRLGDNARLIQQTDGWGHCAAFHFSYCTALATQEYMLDGVIPEKRHTECKVDQVPFQPFEPAVDLVGGGEEAELSRAWWELSKERMWLA